MYYIIYINSFDRTEKYKLFNRYVNDLMNYIYIYKKK